MHYYRAAILCFRVYIYIGNLSVLFALLFDNNREFLCNEAFHGARGKYGLIRYIYLWMEIFRFTRGSRIKSWRIKPFCPNDSSSSRSAISKSFCELNRIHTRNFVGSWPRKGLCLIPSVLSLYFSRSIHTHTRTHTLLSVSSPVSIPT